MTRPAHLFLLAWPLLLAGCDLLGIESASDVAARREAEGKAIGGACRHAARSIEACYESNKRADKAAVFAGWREMNDYMRENKLDAMPPQALAKAATKDSEVVDGESEAAPAKAAGGKAGTTSGTSGAKGAARPAGRADSPAPSEGADAADGAPAKTERRAKAEAGTPDPPARKAAASR